MDFINRSFEQLSELFRSMTPGGRITAGLLLAVVVVSIAFLMNTKVDGPDEYLLGGQSFSTEEISAMQVAFGKSGLSSFEVVGGQVRIPKSQQASYLAALADGDALPRNFGEYVTRALENSSMMTTSSDRQQLVHFAKIQDYSATIRKLPFVKGATIAYDPKRHSGFRRQPPTKATATVTPRGAGQLDDQQVLAIRSIVAGGFGLEPHDVIVVDTNGRIHNATRAGDVAAGVDNPYLKTQVAHENSFRDKIYEALDYIPGVHVTVNVKLDPTTRNVSEQVAMDPDSTIVLNSRSEKHKSTTTQSRGGRVGLAAQSGANSALSLGGSDGGTNSLESNESKEDFRTAPYEKTLTENAALTPESVTVAVDVPRTYIEQVFREQQAPTAEGEQPVEPTEQQLLAIESTVRRNLLAQVPNMIPRAAGVAPEDVVAISFFTPSRLPEVEGPPITETASSWLAMNWTTLGTFGIAGFGLIVLRSMVKSSPTVAPLAPQVASAPSEPASEEASDGGKTPTRQLRRNIPSGPNLAEELAEIVREDTQAAANVLRGWITSGT